jgi:acyl carrier protein
MISSEAAATGQPGRKQKIVTDLKAVIKELSGQDQSGADISASFFDLGFDSLFLTQASQAFRSKFGVKVTFRQLLEELSTIDAVANYLDQQMPLGKVEIAPAALPSRTTRPVFAPPPPPPRPTTVSPTVLSALPEPALPALTEAFPNGHPPKPIPAGDEGALTSTVLERIMKQQLRVMSQQLEMLRGSHPGKFTLPPIPAGTTSNAAEPAQPPKESNLPPAPITPTPAKAESVKTESRFFGPYKPIDKSVSRAKSRGERGTKTAISAPAAR